LELLLTVSWMHDGQQRLDVRADVAADHRVGELVEALAEHVGLTEPVSLRLRRTGALLDPQATVHDAELLSGDDVSLVADGTQRSAKGRPASQALVSLDLMGGPEAGRFVLLGAGLFSVGAAPSNGVRIHDPTLASDHVVLRVQPDAQVSVALASQSVGVELNGMMIGQATALSSADVVRIGDTTFAVRPIAAALTPHRDLLGQVPFHRTPYRPVVVAEHDLGELGPVPKQSTQRRFTIATMLLPLGSGIAMAAISHRPEFLLLTGLAPLVMVYNFFDDRRHGRRSFHKQSIEFRAATTTYAAAMRDAIDAEERDRRQAAPDLPELHRRAHYRTRFLWERDRAATDLLTVRVGLGSLPSKVTVTVDERGDATLRDEALASLQGFESVHDVPVTLSLTNLGAIAAWGHPNKVERLAASLLLQAVCLQSPDDVVITAALAPERADVLDWLKWSPHTRAASSPLAGAHLVDSRDAAEELLVRLIEVLIRRQQAASGSQSGPWLLIVLDERLNLDAALVSQVLDQLAGADASVIWIGDHDHRVPRQCTAVIDVANTGSSRVWFTDPARPAMMVDVELANALGARRAALALAPVRDASAASATAALPRTVSLMEALGTDTMDADVIAKLWAAADPDGLCAPIGQGANGPCCIDLVRQGPHTLIAGTSGAGKSELLQTLVCSLAASYSPADVTFLFVDYKGGASSADFVHLPHTVGSVTNLGVGMARRALVSLQAELTRRMALMEGRAKDLAEFRASYPADAPPRLVIVVDEFATLAKELPDFVAGVVDIAQRGRSLGIHLVLATQRPAGAVNENILANTNLRLGLRMLDPADSLSVLGSPEAADIPVPLVGRAMARTGRRELTAFQTAWCGAFVPQATQARRPVVIQPFDESVLQPVPLTKEASSAQTQLHAVVAAATAAHAQSGCPLPRRPWLDPLPDAVVLPLTMPEHRTADPGRTVSLGVVDRPERQTQESASVDLEETGGLIVLGMGGSGKTTLLRSAALDVAGQGSPEEVVVFGLDAAGRGLSPLKALPHCGLIASADDLESVTRLLSYLQTEIEQRRLLLAAAEVDSLTTLRKVRGATTPPRILFLVDGYGSFQAMCDSPELFGWVQVLQRIVTDGRPVGLHTIMTVDRRMSIPGALASSMAGRVVLRMADSEALVDCGVMSTVAKQVDLSVPGRAIFGRSDLMQVAVAGGEDPMLQAAAIEVWGDRLRSTYSSCAFAPAALPAAVRVQESTTPWHVALGQQDLTGTVLELDQSSSDLVISGPPGSGRTTAAVTIAQGLVSSGVSNVALISSGVSHVLGVTVVSSGEQRQQVLDDLQSALSGPQTREPTMVLVLDDADRLDDPELAAILDKIVRDDRVRLICAVDSRVVAGGYQAGWMGELRRVRRQLLLQPTGASDVTAVTGVRTSLRAGVPFPVGRGVLTTERAAIVVQISVGALAVRNSG
jgi:DNA segregation ATPase FtsK/SpoIIIE, S-DNA-T family